jgi:hypothetical protein
MSISGSVVSGRNVKSRVNSRHPPNSSNAHAHGPGLLHLERKMVKMLSTKLQRTPRLLIPAYIFPM